MIKLVAMMKRKEGLSLKEFTRYWYEEHAPLGFPILPREFGITQYVQNYAIEWMEGVVVRERVVRP